VDKDVLWLQISVMYSFGVYLIKGQAQISKYAQKHLFLVWLRLLLACLDDLLQWPSIN
jgi:hypothetical protein